MNIKIDIDTDSKLLTFEQTQKIKRVASVLREAGFKVEILWHEVVASEDKGTDNT